MTESFKAGGPDWVNRHLDAYLKTGGKIGHLVDFTPQGAQRTPCLILRTTGRANGEPLHLPLIYGTDGGNFVVVASDDGAPEHPGWLLNLQADAKVKFQVAEAKYMGTATIVSEPERSRLLSMMAAIYPPFVEHQKNAGREIPVVLLQPESTIEKL